MSPFIEIRGRRIGPGDPAYIVAEMSANHDSRFDRAAGLVKTAKAGSTDAMNLQTYSPDTLTIDCDDDYFRIQGTLWHGRSLFDLYIKKPRRPLRASSLSSFHPPMAACAENKIGRLLS